MKVQNKNKHMWGKQILVNGVRYGVSAEGVVEVPDGVGQRLLAAQEWMPYHARKAPQEPVEAPQTAPKPQPKPEPPKEPEKAPEPAVEAEPPEPGAGGEAESEEGVQDAGEWPDPDKNMSKAYLQEMADAYDVKHDPTMTKRDLIEAIMARMYE